MGDTKAITTSAWQRDATKDSPLRHESGAYLSWDQLKTMQRSMESYNWSLVVASKSGADVEAERRKVDQLSGWVYRLLQTQGGEGG